MLNHGLSRFVLVLAAVACFVIACDSSNADDKVSFRGQIAPLLRDHCLACHGAKKAEGGYRVDSFTRAVAEGEHPLAPVGGRWVEGSAGERP